MDEAGQPERHWTPPAHLWRGARQVCGCARRPGSVWCAAARSTSSSVLLPCVWHLPRTSGRWRPRAPPGPCKRPSLLRGDVPPLSCSSPGCAAPGGAGAPGSAGGAVEAAVAPGGGRPPFVLLVAGLGAYALTQLIE